LNRKFNQTIILVTHNPELAAFATRIVEMRDGLIVGDRLRTPPGKQQELVEQVSRKP
jgi:ABC-type lipoprotein export system ATPase subunit